jgi:hypothetical protein
MIKVKTGLAAVLERAAAVTRLVRPAPAVPPPPYVKCAGCHKGGRDDQQVPDPGQYKAVIDTDGNPVPAGAPGNSEPVRLIDAAPVWCAPCGAWYHAVGCYSTHRH